MFPEFVSLSLFPWGFSLSLSVIKEVLHIHPSSPFVTISSDTQTQEEITQLLVSKSHRELLFQGTHHNPMIWHPGQEKNNEPSHGPLLLAGHTWQCSHMVRSISWMSANKSAGYPKSAIAPTSINQGPVWKDWHGPRWAIIELHKGIALC